MPIIGDHPDPGTYTADNAADDEMDEQVRAIAEAAKAPTLPEPPPDIPGDVDLSETAALKAEMFDEAPERKSNVYSVRLDEELVEAVRDHGEALGLGSMSETIRHILRGATG